MTIQWKKHVEKLRKLIPDDIVNYLYHLPKAVLAVLVFGYPARHLTVVAVTGTSGKTTVVNLIYYILKTANLPVSMISTVKAAIGNKEYDTGFHVTNPDPFELQKLIREAVARGSKYLVLEVTSHGLAQFRNFGVNISLAVITNITHEHLDYHKTMRSYVLTKAKILKGTRYSILNRDDKHFPILRNSAYGRLLTFSLKREADFTPKTFPFRTKLIGIYNKYNILAAIAAVKTLGLEDGVIKKGISSFKGVEGRMEEIKKYRKPYRIFLDFAHKPDALEAVLFASRKLTENRVIIVFGSAGLRDRTKRPMMGQIAGKLADISVLTAEDPRTESVNKIINQIGRGAVKAGAKEVTTRNIGRKTEGKHYFIKIPDRRKAIRFTIEKLAQKGDVVLFCGKGHERSMCFGMTEYPWNEKEEILKALKKRHGK